ncbi:unnamed protein product [Boreogadus saida]
MTIVWPVGKRPHPILLLCQGIGLLGLRKDQVPLKQHTKVNQQAHSTPLKLTLPLKNRFLPLQESTNATHAPLSPEMRPDGQCGQRRKNQSPRRRAVHVSATVQEGPISEKADEPDTLIIGDSTIKDITGIGLLGLRKDQVPLKQHTKVNQQAHSTPLKLTLPLKNRFLPLQESTNATHAPLSPEMRPDGQCGQRRKNQSPRRRAVHVSATVQEGPISEKADEPDTLIIGDSTIKDITATIRAQAEKKRDYSLPHTSTLPLSDTQIADSPQTLNSPPDAIDTTDSPQTLNSPPDAINTVARGTARNGHPSTPPPVPSVPSMVPQCLIDSIAMS